MNAFTDVSQLVGNTPLFWLKDFAKKHGVCANIYAKLESYNPTGSVKDRVALKMIKDAEARGIISPGDTLIEPTSGNTGIGLAALGVSMGYNVIITMPDTMSKERIKMMEAYGAQVVLTEGSKGMLGAIEKAKELCETYKSYHIMGQFTNPSNPDAHYETTGPEIWAQTYGKVDIFISAAGTGGTVSGTGKYLKEKKPDVLVVAAEPDASPVLSGGRASSHKIQGIGAGFIPEIYDADVVEEVIRVTDNEAYTLGAELAKTHGLLVGISSGAALSAAIKIGSREENKGKNIVVILPDNGMRYLSTEGYY